MRVCKTCLAEKPLSKFTLRSGKSRKKTGDVSPSTRGLSCANCDYLKSKDRNRVTLRRWQRENPDRVRGYKTKRLYGIGLVEYQQMFAAQKGLCAICQTPGDSSFKKRTLGVDHDHKTGVVRGLLCDLCNKGIGQFLDRPDFLRSAAAYLSQGRKS